MKPPDDASRDRATAVLGEDDPVFRPHAGLRDQGFIVILCGAFIGFLLISAQVKQDQNRGFAYYYQIAFSFAAPLALLGGGAAAIRSWQVSYLRFAHDVITLKYLLTRVETQADVVGAVKWIIPPTPKFAKPPPPPIEIEGGVKPLIVVPSEYRMEEIPDIAQCVRCLTSHAKHQGWETFELQVLNPLVADRNARANYRERVRRREMRPGEVFVSRRQYDMLAVALGVLTAMTFAFILNAAPDMAAADMAIGVLLTLILVFGGWMPLRNAIHPDGELRLTLWSREALRRSWPILAISIGTLVLFGAMISKAAGWFD